MSTENSENAQITPMVGNCGDREDAAIRQDHICRNLRQEVAAAQEGELRAVARTNRAMNAYYARIREVLAQLEENSQ